MQLTQIALAAWTHLCTQSSFFSPTINDKPIQCNVFLRVPGEVQAQETVGQPSRAKKQSLKVLWNHLLAETFIIGSSSTLEPGVPCEWMPRTKPEGQWHLESTALRPLQWRYAISFQLQQTMEMTSLQLPSSSHYKLPYALDSHTISAAVMPVIVTAIPNLTCWQQKCEKLALVTTTSFFPLQSPSKN